MLIQIASLMGAFFLLGAYWLNSINRLNNKLLVSFLNLIGATILTITASIEHQYGFIILEGTWAIISLYTLFKQRFIN